MKLSQSFTKTFREVGKEEQAKSAGLLIRAGYIHKEMAGVYDYLPLGLRVLKNIQQIIREEINAIDAEELNLTALQSPKLWEATGRWDDQAVDIWFKTDLAAGGQLGLAPTHEEPLTNLMKSYIHSYKDLPVYAYQFQTKFRNELRAKSGILRTREFLMKDLYSFTANKADHEKYYARVEAAYKRIYDRVGIGDDTYETFASGGVFSKYSHEFQTITPVGEDTIYYNADKSVVLNEEVLNDEVLAELGVKREELQSTRAAEVGNIFTLGTKYSAPLGLEFTDSDGSRKPVFMGCYGIGVSRVMGIIVEKYGDDKGLVWPENIAPYKYYLVPIGKDAEAIAKELEQASPETILLDDRPAARPGEKFSDAELMGIPYRVVISDKTLKDSSVELTSRRDNSIKLLTIDEFQSNL
jgi:prolyl-tRNA synthetase